MNSWFMRIEFFKNGNIMYLPLKLKELSIQMLSHVLQFSPVLVLIWSNHHKCCSVYMYFLATCITVQSYPSFDLVQSPQVLFHLHVLQFSPILVLIWSNHHKCCSIYMYFLATCITDQSYLRFDLVQSPQVLFHLHVFPGYMYYSSVLS